MLLLFWSFVVVGCAAEPTAPAPIQPSPGECVVHLELKGMSNPDRCPRMIGDAVQEVDGVRHVTVGYLERMGWVRAVEGSLCTRSKAERLVQAVRRMGYDGRVQRIVFAGGKP
jgi:hypothetical protein